MAKTLGSLNVGDKIKFGTLYDVPITWLVGDKNHEGYPAGSVTFVSEKIIKIMCVDATEPLNSDGSRKTSGNNRWIYSNIRQWLNSAAGAGEWYSAQHSADQAPDVSHIVNGYNPYSDLPGFLNSFTANERNALLSTAITVDRAGVDGGGTESDTCKIFNLSCAEAGLSGGVTAGSLLPLFSTAANRKAYPTAQAVSNSDYTSSSLAVGSQWVWWLRDAYASSSFYVRNVGAGGDLGNTSASDGNRGLRPAFNLSSTLQVSDHPDADGCYRVVFSSAHSLEETYVGDTIEIPVKAAHQSYLGEKLVFKVADKNHEGYPSNSVTLITDKLPMVLAFDAKEPSNSNNDRRLYGNNRYLHANLLQWLNSNASPGQWYSAQHSADAPPSSANVWASVSTPVNPYDAWPGFLAMLDGNFVNALQNTTVTVAKNTVTDGGGSETVASKMFLPSTTEVGLANENGIAEGSKLALFSDNTSRLAYCTQACIDKSNYPNDPATTAAWYWWLRTPNSGNSYNVRYVIISGALSESSAYSGSRGVRPLCNLPASVKLTSSPNADGNYEFIWNQPPVISGSDRNLGTFGESFSGTSYSITDPENDAVTVTEKLDGKLLRSFSATLGTTYTLSITGQAWQKVLNGSHTLTVSATDSSGNITARTLTFTKAITAMEAVMTTVFPADARPSKLLINAQLVLPNGAAFKLEICNNANDASPAWEDVTTAVNTGEIYTFRNTTKTAADWGVQIRCSGDRGTSGAACSLAGIGGTFG